MKDKASALFLEAQNSIVHKLEVLDKAGKFAADNWHRADPKFKDGGGGISKILKNGSIFEQAGVNYSSVHGSLPENATERPPGLAGEESFFATGISMVIHPRSPLIPTTHANCRYLEVGKYRWFGGGADLTPFYLFEEDARSFHQLLREVCDRHSAEYYPKFKKWCDQYFFLPHRGEARGIGGIFFDYLGKDAPEKLEEFFEFAKDFSLNFIEAYIEIVKRRKDLSWSNEQKEFQLIRRGRYVEFNLLYDRGTRFGLQTGGRTESILMSLPPEVKWVYNHTVDPSSRESALLEVLRTPRDWV